MGLFRIKNQIGSEMRPALVGFGKVGEVVVRYSLRIFFAV